MQLIKALKILANSKEEQINYLIELGTFPSTDELALQFDDAYRVFLGNLDERQNADSFDDKTLKLLSNIVSIFNVLSERKEDNVWNVSSLSGSYWNQIRELSKETLMLINESMKTPDGREP
jgi:hypothetical protein